VKDQFACLGYQENGRFNAIAARVKRVADVIVTTQKATGTACKLIAYSGAAHAGPVVLT
jgi:hypothetical protein